MHWPKLIWVCDHCGHWHGASYARWPLDRPPLCKIKGYGRDGKSACGRPMRAVFVAPVEESAMPDAVTTLSSSASLRARGVG